MQAVQQLLEEIEHRVVRPRGGSLPSDTVPVRILTCQMHIYRLELRHDGFLDAAPLFRRAPGARHRQHGRAARRRGAVVRPLRGPGRDRALRCRGRGLPSRRARRVAGFRGRCLRMPRTAVLVMREDDRPAVPCGRVQAGKSGPVAAAAISARLRGRVSMPATSGRHGRHAVRRAVAADPLRGGTCRVGAVAAGGRCLAADPDLPELQLAVSRPQPQCQPAVVRHGGLRQPPQGEAPLRAPQGGRREAVHA